VTGSQNHKKEFLTSVMKCGQLYDPAERVSKSAGQETEWTRAGLDGVVK
jgi:hypothetical protein